MPITFSGMQASGGFSVSTSSPAILAGSMDINVADPFNTNDPAYLRTTPWFPSTNTNLRVGTGAFTIEFWMRPTAFGNGEDFGEIAERIVFDLGAEHIAAPYISFGFNWPLVGASSAPFIRLSGATKFEVGSPLNLDTWYHVAITRSGTVFKVYINGTQTYTNSSVSDDFANSSLAIGDAGNPGYPYSGYLTNFRIVKGVAVYTSNFTPPTSPLTSTQSANTNGNPSAAITGTETGILLNSATSGTLLTDSSSYGMTLSQYGVGSVWNSISPFA